MIHGGVEIDFPGKQSVGYSPIGEAGVCSCCCCCFTSFYPVRLEVTDSKEFSSQQRVPT